MIGREERRRKEGRKEERKTGKKMADCNEQSGFESGSTLHGYFPLLGFCKILTFVAWTSQLHLNSQRIYVV